jgi:hypothetical protein
MKFIEIISWKNKWNPFIFLLFLLLYHNIETFSQTPLILDINLEDEIWLEGQIVIFNGWPPNLRMIIMNDYIIGIDENNIPRGLENHLTYGLPKGTFKLKLIRKTNIPYYETELLVFRIIEYKNIEVYRK